MSQKRKREKKRNKKPKSEKKNHVFGTGVIMSAIAVTISVIALICGICYHLSAVGRYKEQQAPDIDCYYEYFAKEDVCKFHVKNVGLVDCKDIWVEEKVFVIVDEEVYEGDDIPHFNYLVFNGSRTRMWDLMKDSSQAIELEGLQRKAFSQLFKKFQAKVISKWAISFSSKASSKKHKVEKFFLHTLDDGMPQELESYVGGISIHNSVRDYLATGSKRSINIFDLTMEFELDTPRNYWIDKDYSIIPLYPRTTLSIQDINDSLLFCAESEAQAADDSKGSISYAWKHIEGKKWQKWVQVGPGASTVSKPMILVMGYLSKEDREKVLKDPKLLKFLDPNRKPVSIKQNKEKEKEIREKALEKFLSVQRAG